MIVFLSHFLQYWHWYIIVHTTECALTSFWQKMMKKLTSPAILKENFNMEIDGECTGSPMMTEDTALLNMSQTKTFKKDMIWFTLNQTGYQSQPALVIPNNASLPELHTAAAAAPFVNIDSSGLRIHIPVLKRKREKQWECSSISTLKAHLLLQSYNWWIPRKEE